MLNKIIVSLLSLFALLFITAGSSFAATSVRLQEPQSPTNKDTFNITFVALDTNSTQTVTVQCQKKGPGDADFVNFGSLFSLPNGGNTDNCQTNSGILNQNATYQFRVIANGSGSQTSNVVSVDFNNSTPGTPVNYNKTKPDNCTYKISFRTANDSGKTVKVVLYRSTETNFSLDSGHQVNEVSIGSDTDGSMTDNVSPNCDRTYYFVIRAFDTFGNGSGVVGDSNVTTTTINPTGTQTQGAIPVGGTGGGSVLGAGTGGENGGSKEVLGTESGKETPTPTKKAEVSQNPVTNLVTWAGTHKALSLLVIVLIVAVAYYLYLRFSKRVK